MRILGISASIALVYEDLFNELGVSGSGHDSAAVIVEDGKVIAAIEQERIDRIKHSNKVPIMAIKECLKKCNLSIEDIDYVAVNYREDGIDMKLQEHFLDHQSQKRFLDLRYYMNRIFIEGFGRTFDNDKLLFVPHNTSHAVSAFAMSGFKNSLVLITDGMGDDSAGVILDCNNGEVKALHTIPVSQSLGNFYIQSIRYLGYGANDEYKVMGLAPYGDPSKYRKYFNKIVKLLPEGKYEIQPLYPILFQLGEPRRKGEEFNQVHKDIAASIQETLEKTIMHVLEYYSKITGHKNLCIAGGVAHNCSTNGKILYSGLFDHVFVQPAAHDAGAVMGAALHIWQQKMNQPVGLNQMNHVYLGRSIGDNDEIFKELTKWSDLLNIHKSENIIEETAQLLVDKKIIGWVQGTSEFGPRALGNRSILADPRPEENKQIINQMVKKREGYRPFAPSVLEEYIEEYFEVPDCKAPYYFMNFVINVKKEKREILGAVTHVDGTARIQTISKETNELYWELIHQFYELTGIPILLNTSFNNNAEPIIDTVEDAIVCFLTTNLHYLVVGDYIIHKKDYDSNIYKNLKICLPQYVKLHHCRKDCGKEKRVDEYSLGVTYSKTSNVLLSKDCYEFLLNINNEETIHEVLTKMDISNLYEDIIKELIELWEKRLIELKIGP